MQILATPKVTVHSNVLQIHAAFLLSEAFFSPARLLQHKKYGMRRQSMKLHYVSFIYLGPRKEVNLNFSTVIKYSRFASALYYSFFIFVLQLCLLKKRVFLKKLLQILENTFWRRSQRRGSVWAEIADCSYGGEIGSAVSSCCFVSWLAASGELLTEQAIWYVSCPVHCLV